MKVVSLIVACILNSSITKAQFYDHDDAFDMYEEVGDDRI